MNIVLKHQRTLRLVNQEMRHHHFETFWASLPTEIIKAFKSAYLARIIDAMWRQYERGYTRGFESKEYIL